MSGTVTITAKLVDADKARQGIDQINQAMEMQAKRTAEAKARVDDLVKSGMSLAQATRQVSAETKVVDLATRSSIAAIREQDAAYKAQASASRAHVQALKEEAEAQRAARQAAKEHGEGLAGLAAEIGKGAASFALAQIGLRSIESAFEGVKRVAEESVHAYAEFEQSMHSLDNVVSHLGGNVLKTREMVMKYNDAVSSEGAVAQAARNFASMNLPLETQAKLIEAIRDGAVGMGANVNEQMVLISKAIKQGNSELLDNIGVVTNVSEMYKTYAARVGKTAEALTQEEKNQAIVIGVLKETQKYHGMAADSMNTLQGRINANKKSWLDLTTAIGEKLNPAYTALLDVMTKVNREIQRTVNPDYGKPLKKQLEEAKAALKTAEDHYRDAKKEDAGGGLFGMLGDQQALEAVVAARKHVLDLQQEIKHLSEKHAKPPTDPEADAAAKKAAEEAAKKAKKDRERLAKDLAESRITAGKEGLEKELGQEEVWHQKQIALAHGQKAKLEQIEEEHQRRKAAIIEKWNAKYADADLQHIQKLIKSQGAANVMGPFTPAEQKAVDAANQAEIWKKIEAETKTYVAGEVHNQDAAEKEAEKKRRAAEDAAKKMEDAFQRGGEFAASALDRVFSAKTFREATDGLYSSAASAAGMGFLDEMRPEKVVDRITHALGGKSAEEQIAEAQQKVKEIEAEQAKKFSDAIGKASSAINDKLASAAERAANGLLQVQRASELSDRLGIGLGDAQLDNDVARGRVTSEEAQRRRAIRDANRGVDAVQKEIGDSVPNIDRIGRELIDAARLSIEYGNEAAAKESLKNAGVDVKALDLVISDLRDAIRTRDLKIDTVAASAEAEAKRVTPGSTPDKPSFVFMVNAKDIAAYIPAGARFRANESVTRRADPSPSGRGIDVGRSV